MKQSYKILILITIFIALKYTFSKLTINELYFFSYPIAKLIQIILNTDYVYIVNEGFYFESIDILIDKSCSGTNFFLILMLSLNYRISYERTLNIIHFAITLIASYILTILTNTSRITAAILFRKSDLKLNINEDIFHQIQGIFIYLFYLITIFILFDYILKKHTK